MTIVDIDRRSNKRIEQREKSSRKKKKSKTNVILSSLKTNV